MKKVISLFMACALCLCTAIPAFAAEDVATPNDELVGGATVNDATDETLASVRWPIMTSEQWPSAEKVLPRKTATMEAVWLLKSRAGATLLDWIFKPSSTLRATRHWCTRFLLMDKPTSGIGFPWGRTVAEMFISNMSATKILMPLFTLRQQLIAGNE